MTCQGVNGAVFCFILVLTCRKYVILLIYPDSLTAITIVKWKRKEREKIFSKAFTKQIIWKLYLVTLIEYHMQLFLLVLIFSLQIVSFNLNKVYLCCMYFILSFIYINVSTCCTPLIAAPNHIFKKIGIGGWLLHLWKVSFFSIESALVL